MAGVSPIQSCHSYMDGVRGGGGGGVEKFNHTWKSIAIWVYTHIELVEE